MSWLHLAAIAGAAMALTAGAQPLLIAWAARRRIVAVPNARSSHTQATPVGGGLPLAALLVLAALGVGMPAGAGDPWAITFALALAALAGVSWLDDVSGIGAGVRLAVQVALAAWVVFAITSAGSAAVSPALAALAVVWIVGVTNAYNFMDGIDGIAGAQAFVAGLCWIWLGTTAGQPLATGLGAVTAGAAIGFLPFNWQPARIFMGDVGAAPLGFALAVLAVVVLPAGWRFAAAGALAVWPFLFDAAVTLLGRLLRRENVLEAHRSHLYQRLVRAGWSHGRVTALYAVLAAAGWSLGVLLVAGPAAAAAVVPVAVAGLGAGLWALAAAAERRSGA